MNLKKIGIRVLVVVGLFLGGIVLFNSVLMPMLVHQRGTVIVPDLHNVSDQQAGKTLDRYGLNMRVTREEYHPQVPKGYVISQAPRANESIKEGRTVEVVVSLGARTARVPDLSGMSLRQTRGVLDRANLRVGRVSRVLVEGESREQVVASWPVAGDELVEGSTIDLVLSVGGQKREYEMPDLSGQDLLFIRDKLREMGFRISGVRYEKRDGVFPNTIVGQNPKPGAMIREGDSIELVAASSD
jgi:serine/threonine-protein kinase